MDVTNKILDDPRIKAIQEGSAMVKEAATQLSNRIEHFQAFLNGLPGKCSATHVAQTICLHLDRQGKKWIIYWSDPANDEEMPTPLTEASLKVKMAALKELPALLEAIKTNQSDLIGDIRKTCEEWDEYAKGLGIKG